MTPQERQMLQEIYQWMQQKKVQQISQPLDDSSRNIINGTLNSVSFSIDDLTTAKTQVYNVAGGAGGTVTAPKAYAGYEVLLINNIPRKVPYIA